MTSAAAADGSAEGDGGSAAGSQDEHKAQIESDLQDLIGRLESRLQGSEPFRAQRQFEARKAEGRPLDAEMERTLAAHLSEALECERDYRLLMALQKAQRRWHGEPEPVGSFAPPVPPGAVVEATPPPPDGKAEPDAAYAAASAAVAAMFIAAKPNDAAPEPRPTPAGARENSEGEAAAMAAVLVISAVAQPAAEGASNPSKAVGAVAKPSQTADVDRDTIATAAEPAAQPSASQAVAAMRPSDSVDLPPLAPPPIRIAPSDPVEAAEADVLASLAKLRAPVPEAGPAEFPDQPAPVSSGLASSAPLQASQTVWPKTLGPKSPPLSLEGTMANVAKAVAATVATAGRIAEPASESRTDVGGAADPAKLAYDHYGPGPFARPQTIESAGSAGNANGPADEVTEIRFVARPANPAIDTPPPVSPTPLAIDEAQRLAADVPAAWEEASIEIRRPENAQESVGIETELRQENPGRVTVLNRFVKALRGEKG